MAKRRLEEFELGRVLGVGTAGTIYEAWDKVIGQKVALKILLPTVSADKIVSARFEREMLILRTEWRAVVLCHRIAQRRHAER